MGAKRPTVLVCTTSTTIFVGRFAPGAKRRTILVRTTMLLFL